MSFTNTKPMSFGKFFNLFYKYWDAASKRGTGYNALEVILFTKILFMDLRTE